MTVIIVMLILTLICLVLLCSCNVNNKYEKDIDDKEQMEWLKEWNEKRNK